MLLAIGIIFKLLKRLTTFSATSTVAYSLLASTSAKNALATSSSGKEAPSVFEKKEEKRTM
jgi:hypothetical protein